jgi:ABC-2 type transport system permease protein
MWRNSFYNELIKITARPRSFLGVAAITLIIVLIEMAMKIDGLSYIQFITAPIEQNLIIEGNILNGNLHVFETNFLNRLGCTHVILFFEVM